jgi:NADPH:quinone reductase-like Zn-dependent oxidoreductase
MPGDAVFGMARLKQGGAFGHAVITNDDFMARKPDAISFESAACLATPGVTAWNGLVDNARHTLAICRFEAAPDACRRADADREGRAPRDGAGESRPCALER